VIVLILMMLIIIPLLTVTDPDISLSLGVQFVHQLGVLASGDPTTYGVGSCCSLL
jgi:precorrin-6B methylase 1